MKEDMLSHNFRRVFVIATRHVQAEITALEKELANVGSELLVDYSIRQEPSFHDFETILQSAQDFRADCIIGVGGGSIMDVAKLIAAQINNSQTLDEIIGIKSLKGRSIYLICAPTTSGTGSEVSPGAIFIDKDENKVGIISPYLVPDAAYICPELTLSVPPFFTAATAIDALTHCLEAFTNNFSHPMTDLIAKEGIRLIVENLPIAYENGNDLPARTALALGSLYGGMCLGPVNTAAVHALAYPLGATYKIPHGLSNAIMLPYVMEFNLPNSIQKYAEIGRAISDDTGLSDGAMAEAAIAQIRSLIEGVKLPSRLRDVDIPKSAIDAMARDALKIQRLLKNNPRDVTLNDALNIYRNAW